MDDQGEHDVGEGQGDDEHFHGAELPFTEHENQDDQQVENAAHNNYKTIILCSAFGLVKFQIQIQD